MHDTSHEHAIFTCIFSIEQKRNAQFEAFRSGDAADTTDVLARLAVVLVCGVALWFATGQMVMLLWCIGYWPLIILYVF
ncbi:MAG: hypothetical protein ACSHXW_04215 [Yoonia sp.]